MKTGHFTKRIRGEAGLTLVELLVSLSIILIVVAAAYFIFLYQTGVFRESKSISVEQERLNIAFNAVRYKLRIAGYDYGSGFYYQSCPPLYPVYFFNAADSLKGGVTNAYPFEVLISYDTIPGSYSSVFLIDELNTLTNKINNLKLLRGLLCSTGVLQLTRTILGILNFSKQNVVNQTMFYWGPSSYNAPPVSKLNGRIIRSPYNVPGVLYECSLVYPTNSPGNPPVCLSGTVLELDNYVNNFNIVANAGYKSAAGYYYSYIVSISVESNVAVTPSPAYSVHTLFTKSPAGATPQQESGVAIPGYNIVKTLTASVYLRNVKYDQ